VLKELFTEGVLDISWSRDGIKLLVSSNSGAVALIVFKENELGTPLPESDVHDLIKNNYGDVSRSALPENPLQIQLEKTSVAATPVEQHQPVANATPNINILQPRVKSTLGTATTPAPVVTILPDGRKRVAPTLISQLPSPAASTSVATFSAPGSVASLLNSATTSASTSSTTSTTTTTTTTTSSTVAMEMEDGIEVVQVTIPGKEPETAKRKVI
jgi:hypothetical protein